MFKNPVAFWDAQKLRETPNIQKRCNLDYLTKCLGEMYPNEKIHIVGVSVNTVGSYTNPLVGSPLAMFASGLEMNGLPPYCEVQLEHQTPGDHVAKIIIWSPLAWNDRFMGTGGGAASTGGIANINRTDDYARGMTVPNAVYNGFTAATTDAGNISFLHDWALDTKTNTLDWERIENWRARATHWMTLFGKAVAEILHQRPVQYAYFHGASGGGRQAMVEAQDFPEDYNGIWASSPAINWTKSLLAGLWPIAVMNSYVHRLSPAKLDAFRLAVHHSVGGSATYFKLREQVAFDAADAVGTATTDGPITALDAKIMNEIWEGPHRARGERLWVFFRPGGLFWNSSGAPTTAFYFLPDNSEPQFFPFYARWVMQDATRDFLDITKESYITLFDQSVSVFAKAAGDSLALQPFIQAGGKLLMDHGLDDPLIVTDGTIDYYRRLCDAMNGETDVREFCRLYMNPGDGHASCNWHGPGLTESVGMRALIDWVERERTPEALPGVQVDPISQAVVCRSTLTPE